jgi:hypothetical protein
LFILTNPSYGSGYKESRSALGYQVALHQLWDGKIGTQGQQTQ